MLWPSTAVLFNDYPPAALTLDRDRRATLHMSKISASSDIYEQAHLPAGHRTCWSSSTSSRSCSAIASSHAPARTTRHAVSEAATAFVNLLLERRRSTQHPIYVVLTMRSDFLGDCTQLPGLAEAINAGQYLVPRMTRDERRQPSPAPSQSAAQRSAPVLLTRLVNDVGDNPDQLSILQHALNRTWARWQNEGGGTGALWT